MTESDETAKLPDDLAARIAGLTQGQIDCLLLVDQHLSSREIAAELNVSPHTVDQRVRIALQALGVERRTHAARIVAAYNQPYQRLIHGAPSAQLTDHESQIAPTSDLRSNSAAKTRGAKLGRSETVTVRLDPKLNYLCELAARAQRRTKSSFIEWAIAESLGSVILPEVTRHGPSFDDVTLKEKASEIWHVDEPDRVVALALIAPALLNHEEQLIWRLIRENGYLWRGHYSKQHEWTWDIAEDKLVRDRLRDNWETFKGVALGELPKEHLPTWRHHEFDGDEDGGVPF